MISLQDYAASLRAAMEAGDEITWSRLLGKYSVCDHGAQLISCQEPIEPSGQGAIRSLWRYGVTVSEK